MSVETSTSPAPLAQLAMEVLRVGSSTHWACSMKEATRAIIRNSCFFMLIDLVDAKIAFLDKTETDFHFLSNYSASTKNTATCRMPLAPMTKVCSMSVVRLGPVTKVSCDGILLP